MSKEKEKTNNFAIEPYANLQTSLLGWDISCRQSRWPMWYKLKSHRKASLSPQNSCRYFDLLSNVENLTIKWHLLDFKFSFLFKKVMYTYIYTPTKTPKLFSVIYTSVWIRDGCLVLNFSLEGRHLLPSRWRGPQKGYREGPRVKYVDRWQKPLFHDFAQICL